jgi:hypothetical protein
MIEQEPAKAASLMAESSWRQINVPPAGTLVELAPGESYQNRERVVRVRVEGARSGDAVAISVLAETGQDLILVASRAFKVGAEGSLRIPLTPNGTIRVWLRINGNGQAATVMSREVTANWRTISVGGWPRKTLVQATDRVIPFDLATRNGLSAQVKADLPVDGGSVLDVVTKGHSGGLKLVDSREMSYASQDRLSIRAPGGDGSQLWLYARSLGHSGQLVWSNWRRDDDRERLDASTAPTQSALDLAAWLSAQRQLRGASVVDVRTLAQSLQVLLDNGNGSGRVALQSHNLLKNPNLDDGKMTDWTPVAASSDTWLGAEPRHGAAGEWVAVIRSDTAGYHGGWCQTIAVQPGQEYLYLVQAEAALEGPGKATLLYWDYRRFGRFLSSTEESVKKSSAAWAPYWYVVKAPAGVISISVCPALLTDAGAVRYSRAWFIPLDALP